MSDSRLPYTPRSYSDLKAKSFALAAGIEAFAPKLPPLPESFIGYAPMVKWALVPFQNRDPEDAEFVGECIAEVRALCQEIVPKVSPWVMGEPFGQIIWAWEPVRPNSGWIRVRLPQMYLLARAGRCHLEGWTYEDEDAWRFGLSDLINRVGFDKNYTRPGQRS